jgi:hypothetical protein
MFSFLSRWNHLVFDSLDARSSLPYEMQKQILGFIHQCGFGGEKVPARYKILGLFALLPLRSSSITLKNQRPGRGCFTAKSFPDVRRSAGL